MDLLTPAKETVRAWLASWWPFRPAAEALGREYAALYEECPRVLADLKRFCCGDDSTHVPGDPETSLINVGKREVWLHIQNMAELKPDDLRHLKERTERDDA